MFAEIHNTWIGYRFTIVFVVHVASKTTAIGVAKHIDSIFRCKMITHELRSPFCSSSVSVGFRATFNTQSIECFPAPFTHHIPKHLTNRFNASLWIWICMRWIAKEKPNVQDQCWIEAAAWIATEFVFSIAVDSVWIVCLAKQVEQNVHSTGCYKPDKTLNNHFTTVVIWCKTAASIGPASRYITSFLCRFVRVLFVVRSSVVF